MTALTGQQKSPWILAGLLLGHVMLMAYFARHPDSEQSLLSTWIMTGFTPIVRGVDWGVSKVTGGIGGYADMRRAQERNVELQARLEELTQERDRAVERAADYEQLRSQLALPTRPQYAELAANVISRDTSLWFRRLVIDRGSSDGIRRNMPVATATGIVGRVISVGPVHAVVQVITDKHAGVGAMLQSSRAKGEVRGLDDGQCELQNISSSESIEVGETVITSGLDRIYPKGLVVGRVERLEVDPNASWHKIIIKPSAPVDRIEQVFVLLVDHKDLTVEETVSM
jgi:rod shape-determining protein MreC